MKDLTTEQYRLIYDQPIYPKNLYLDRAPYTHEEYREQVLEPRSTVALHGARRLRRAEHGRGLQREHKVPLYDFRSPPPRSGSSMLPLSAERSASVGDNRAARSAGYSPATPPTHTATSTPPANATTGTAAVQPSELA